MNPIEPKDSLPANEMPEIGGKNISDRQAEAGFETMKKTSENAANADNAAFGDKRAARDRYFDLLDEGMKKSETHQERTDFADRAKDAYEDDLKATNDMHGRSHETQRSLGRIAGETMVWIAGGVALVGGYLYLKGKGMLK